MHNLAPQKLVVLNIPAAGWAVSSEEHVEWLRIASPIGMPLKKGCGQGWELWYQQWHSYNGPAVTWLQGYAPVSCSHWFVSCPSESPKTCFHQECLPGPQAGRYCEGQLLAVECKFRTALLLP